MAAPGAAARRPGRGEGVEVAVAILVADQAPAAGGALERYGTTVSRLTVSKTIARSRVLRVTRAECEGGPR